jgi:hypothetical protein
MRNTARSIALAGVLALPLGTSAQGYAELHLQLPEILPAPVLIQPGVQAIPEIPQEVFLVQGEYYTRHGGGWYRAPDPRAGAWTFVPADAVPASLVKIPAGKYRYWKPTREEKEYAKQQEKEQGKGAK